MERDERTLVTEAQVMHHPRIPWQQFERFRRGTVHSSRAFALLNVIKLTDGMAFHMSGESGCYFIRFVLDSCPTTTSVRCNCPDHYPGLCKHICWLVFKVLKHDDPDIFRTGRFPKERLGTLLEDEGARALMVETWGESATPVRSSPLAVPASWPPSDVDCAICFDGMLEQRTARQCQKCSNCFHKACINRWFSQKRSCPLCRHIF